MDTLTTKVEIKPYFHNVLFVNICKLFNQLPPGLAAKTMGIPLAHRYYTQQPMVDKDLI